MFDVSKTKLHYSMYCGIQFSCLILLEAQVWFIRFLCTLYTVQGLLYALVTLFLPRNMYSAESTSDTVRRCTKTEPAVDEAASTITCMVCGHKVCLACKPYRYILYLVLFLPLHPWQPWFWCRYSDYFWDSVQNSKLVS